VLLGLCGGCGDFLVVDFIVLCWIDGMDGLAVAISFF